MKKIIALAVASAFVAPAVMAEAVIYGSLRPHVQYDNVSGTNSISRVELVDDVSRIGFKGTDKLDNGLQLFWQVENRVRIGTQNNAGTTNGFTSRDSFVGVRGNFGEIAAGKLSDLTDQFVEITTALDYWNGNNSIYYSLLTQGDTARLPNAAQYTSPVILGGLQAKALYDFGRKTSTANYQGYQGSLSYSTKLFKVGGVYKQNNDTSASGENSTGSSTVTPVTGDFYKSIILGGNITPAAGLDISLAWNRLKQRGAVAAQETQRDVWAAGVTYLTGKHGIGLQYARAGDLKNNTLGTSTADSGATALVAQYKYSLSKQTTAIATIGYTKNDSAVAAANSVNMGGTSTTGVTGSGLKITTVTAGVRTDF